MDVSGRSFRFFRREGVFALGLAALTIAIYCQVYRFDFLDYDDPFYVSSNPAILSGLNLGSVRWAFDDVHAGWWIPMTWLSLMLDATCYGSWPGGYHITNALLHLANVLLVFAIFARATGNPRSSALVAALFAVHPLHAESVAWITERKDVLSMFFGLLSLFAYVRYAQLDRARRRARSGADAGVGVLRVQPDVQAGVRDSAVSVFAPGLLATGTAWGPTRASGGRCRQPTGSCR